MDFRKLLLQERRKAREKKFDVEVKKRNGGEIIGEENAREERDDTISPSSPSPSSSDPFEP